MNVIHLMTIIDHSDFGKRHHASSHATAQGAYTYAERIVLPGLYERIEPEFHGSLEVVVVEVPFHAEELK